jgi:hypothetical protein
VIGPFHFGDNRSDNLRRLHKRHSQFCDQSTIVARRGTILKTLDPLRIQRTVTVALRRCLQERMRVPPRSAPVLHLEAWLLLTPSVETNRTRAVVHWNLRMEQNKAKEVCSRVLPF